jgi:cyclophilin family peptidyl-prolyl cis-trans isomerase
VGTAKRERQKANRQAKLERIVAEEKKQKVKRTGLRFGIGIPLAIAAVVLIAWIFNDGNDDPGEAQSTTPTTSPIATPVSGNPVVTATPNSVVPVAPTTVGEVAKVDATCPATDGSQTQAYSFNSSFPTCIDEAKTYTATFDTNKGKLVVALETKDYPATVNNFVSLARYKYYDKNTCHRIIKGFVVQCGRPLGNEELPSYKINEEIPKRPYKVGDLVMAKQSAPNTTGGQIFIITGPDGAALPQEYSIVGSITEGLEVASAMEAAANPNDDRTPLEDIVINSVTIAET